tara:strand:- start:732 stop:848 length:117 start_codon:yes stop_codon:yes gene_type:complete
MLPNSYKLAARETSDEKDRNIARIRSYLNALKYHLLRR